MKNEDILKQLENEIGLSWKIIEKRIRKYRCIHCGKKLGKFIRKGKKWDGHSYWHSCGCISSNIIICSG